MIAVERADRLAPQDLVFLQVLRCQNGAVIAHVLRNAPPQFAIVEKVGAVPGYGFKRIRVVGSNESRPLPSRQALFQEDLGGVPVSGKRRLMAFYEVRQQG